MKIDSQSIEFSPIETLQVRILPAQSKDTFIFIPTFKNMEKLEEQARICFQAAKNHFASSSKKFSKYHEVIIYFENRNAIYEGQSFGLALAIGMIERLSLIYNLPYITLIKSGIATTGSFDENYAVNSIGDENIRKKVRALFFFNSNYFVIPKSDESAAAAELHKLKNDFPKRELKLVPIKNLDDFIERRSLVEIKKQKVFVRAGKGLIRNKISFLLIALILLILTYFSFYEFDENPYTYKATENAIMIQNKSGKNLWNIQGYFDFKSAGIMMEIKQKINIVDFNSDGKKEVLFCFDPTNSAYSNVNSSSGLVVLDYKGKEISRMTFNKFLTSKREDLHPPFSIKMLDKLFFNNELYFLCASNNQNSYPSALFLLNVKRNKVVGDTLWNHGFVSDARIVDFDNNGEKEVIFFASNNAMNKSSLVHIALKNLTGQIPSNDDYKLLGIKGAKILHYFLLPNTDYNQFLGYRNPGIFYPLRIENYEVKFVTSESGNKLNNTADISYCWNYKQNEFSIFMSNEIRVARDTLVARGKLNPPYTDTREYRGFLHNQIQAWDGEKFIPFTEYKKLIGKEQQTNLVNN